MDDAGPGPNGMRHLEQTLRAIAPLGLDKLEAFEVMGQVDDYVFGYALREVQEREEHAREVESGDYPLIHGLFGDLDEIVEFMSRPDRFDRGLSRLLDGIEAAFDSK